MAGILGLFWLDRDRSSRPSPALWISVVWFMLACSRSVSEWLYPDQTVSMQMQMTEGSLLDRVVYTGFLLLGLVVLVRRGDRVIGILRQIWPILMFFALCIVSLAWSEYPLVAFKRWNKAIGDLVMVLIVWTDPQPLNALKRLLSRTSYILVPVSILLIKYYPVFGRTYGRWLGEVHYTGVTTNKNSLGALCLIFGVAAVWQIVDLFDEEPKGPLRTRRVLVQLVVVGMICWLLSIADSMTALTCFILTVALMLMIRLRAVRRNPASAHLLSLVMALVPALVVFTGFIEGALQGLGRNATLTDRTTIWSMVINLTPNRWLGTGYESFWLGRRLDVMAKAFPWVPNEAHNGYIEIYANLGWLGVACLVVVLWHGYRRVHRAWDQNLPASDLMFAFFYAAFVYNYTEAAFFKMMAPIWLFFLLAVIGFPRNALVSATHPTEDSIEDLVEEHAYASLESDELIYQSPGPTATLERIF